MLSTLHIENIAVIKKADIDFENGFTVLSGETGAGKSILIDSINLLLGNRVSHELIRNGESTALVSAVFTGLSDATVTAVAQFGIECEDHSVMISRTLSKDGKSVSRIDGRAVTLGLLREVTGRLVSIHGQNDSQRFLNKSAHAELLDSYSKNAQILAEYAEVYQKLVSCEQEFEELTSSEAEMNRLADILAFQTNEIESAKLKPGEEEKLEIERKKLQNAEKISKQVGLSYKILYGADSGGSVTYLLDRAANAMKQISGVVPEAEEISSKLTEYKYEIRDIAESIEAMAELPEGDPGTRLDKIEDRLYLISKLRKKYGSTIEEIISFGKAAREKLESIENYDVNRAKLEEKLKQYDAKAREVAAKITESRRRHAEEIKTDVAESLKFLDMPDVRFEISVKDSGKLRSDGADDVEFMIATNKGEVLMPMAAIASGGELSRIMLSLKSVISDREETATSIYDEVDAGISGKTSRKVGIKLKSLSGRSQIICVTHSAQIASLADNHKKIVKSEVGGRAETDVLDLDEDGRIEEVARILGGIDITDVQRAAAAEMIGERKNY